MRCTDRHDSRQYADATFRVVWLPPYCPELNDIDRIWKYVKGAGLANYCFGNVDNLRDAVANVFEELNRSDNHELALSFRDPLTKILLRVA